jgi:hypothetical protein
MTEISYALPTVGDPAPTRSPLVVQLRSMAADTLLPLALYWVARHFGLAEVQALLVTMVLPIATGLWSLRSHRKISPTSLLVFCGIMISLGAMLLGGGTRVLLLRESLLTAALGACCLFTSPTRRPLMFYFARHAVAGASAEASAAFTQRLATPGFLRAQRIITGVWGIIFLTEFSMRAWLVYHAGTATVLSVSPILMNGCILGTLSWTLWYAKRCEAAARD